MNPAQNLIIFAAGLAEKMSAEITSAIKPKANGQLSFSPILLLARHFAAKTLMSVKKVSGVDAGLGRRVGAPSALPPFISLNLKRRGCRKTGIPSDRRRCSLGDLDFPQNGRRRK